MRWWLTACLLLAALALAPGARTQPSASPTRAQLKLMPLPRAAFGRVTTGFDFSSSHWVTNRDAGEGQYDSRLNAAELARIGRVTGYTASYEKDAPNSRALLAANALSQVDLFRTAAGAERYVGLQQDSFRRLEGKRLRHHGIVLDRVSRFAVPEVAGAWGAGGRIRIGKEFARLTVAQFRVGSVAAVVGLLRTDDRDVRADVRRSARELDSRIRGVLAGRIH